MLVSYCNRAVNFIFFVISCIQFVVHNFLCSFSNTKFRIILDFFRLGQYELHSCVTHKGRSADSGHYIGWVRQQPGSEYWWKYDDEIVTETTTEEVMKLKGGGDRDTAYLMFYRFKELKSL